MAYKALLRIRSEMALSLSMLCGLLNVSPHDTELQQFIMNMALVKPKTARRLFAEHPTVAAKSIKRTNVGWDSRPATGGLYSDRSSTEETRSWQWPLVFARKSPRDVKDVP